MTDERQGSQAEQAPRRIIDRVKSHLPDSTQHLLDRIAATLKGQGRKAAFDAIISSPDNAELQPIPDNLTPEAIYRTYRSSQRSEQLPQMSPVKEVKGLSPEKLTQATEQLKRIQELFAKAEKPLVTGFTFEATEAGMIQMEYTTADGMRVEMTVGDFDEDLLQKAMPAKNYVGVQRALITIAETGKQFDLMKPPFQKQEHNLLIHIQENDDTLASVTPDDIADVTGRGMEYMNRHGSPDNVLSSVSFNTETNTILSSELFSIADVADLRHEATHGEDQVVLDYHALVKWFNKQPDSIDTRELEVNLSQPLAEMELATELTATSSAIDVITEISEGKGDKDKIVQSVRIYQALALRTYIEKRKINLIIPDSAKHDIAITRLLPMTTLPFIPPTERRQFTKNFIGDTLLGIPQSEIDKRRDAYTRTLKLKRN